MTGFSDELAANICRKRRISREYQAVIDQLGDDAREFEAALANPDVSPAAILRTLNGRGIVVVRNTLERWASRAKGQG